MPDWRHWRLSPRARALPSISLTGRRGRACWRAPARSKRRSRLIGRRSASNAIPPCAVSCSRNAPRCGRTEREGAAPDRALTPRPLDPFAGALDAGARCRVALTHREHFLHRLPIVEPPSRGVALIAMRRHTHLGEHQLGAALHLADVEGRDRVLVLGPVVGTPGLDDAAAGLEREVEPGDVPPPRRELAADASADARGLARERLVLARIHQHVIDALGWGLEPHRLPDGPGGHCRSPPSGIAHHRLCQVMVGKQRVEARVEELIVPPLLAVKVPAGGTHQPQQQHAVALRFGRDREAAVVRERREGIERRSHIEFGTRGIDQRQVHRDPARVWRPAPGIGQELRIRPKFPELPLRLARAEGVEDLEAEPERPGEGHRLLEPRRRLGAEVATGAGIDRPAGKIAGRRISDIEGDTVPFGGDLDQRHCRTREVAIQVRVRKVPSMEAQADLQILAFDSSGNGCSAAVWAEGRVLAREFEPLVVGHAERLVPMIERVLAASGLGFADLALIAVTIGPGAFTGVRIGIATAQGLSLGTGLPCLGLSSLETVAEAVPERVLTGRRLTVALDSRREELYLQSFDAERRPLERPALVPPEAWARAVPTGPLVLAGDGASRIAQALGGRELRMAAGPGIPE